MTNKEIAARLREIAGYDKPTHRVVRRDLRELADALDPPKPELGKVVWWRLKYSNQAMYERTGHWRGNGVVDADGDFHRDLDIEYKPARILAPDEVAVKVPPVREWPEATQEVHIWAQYTDGLRGDILATITRAEAEDMER